MNGIPVNEPSISIAGHQLNEAQAHAVCTAIASFHSQVLKPLHFGEGQDAENCRLDYIRSLNEIFTLLRSDWTPPQGNAA